MIQLWWGCGYFCQKVIVQGCGTSLKLSDLKLFNEQKFLIIQQNSKIIKVWVAVRFTPKTNLLTLITHINFDAIKSIEQWFLS